MIEVLVAVVLIVSIGFNIRLHQLLSEKKIGTIELEERIISARRHLVDTQVSLDKAVQVLRWTTTT